MIDEIERAPDRGFTVGDLAKPSGVSARSLQYAFQERHQISPMQCLQQVRLDRAHDALAQGTGSVSAVASHGGFFTRDGSAGETLAHSSIAINGDVHRHVAPDLSRGAVDVLGAAFASKGRPHGGQNGGQAPRDSSRGRPGVLRERPLPCHHSVGLTVSWIRTSRTGVSRHAGLMSQVMPDPRLRVDHVEGAAGHHGDRGGGPEPGRGHRDLRRLQVLAL
ncbi:helix-turn-helix domain-containing protein [Modestobacter sp. VKM Ac-2978]|uniref:helix-turn-helix domain-containing protein n=1 Tax=Modestobacter sp. VKM Ac-2978 TaxID=3004132 RepID=UPI003FA5CA13